MKPKVYTTAAAAREIGISHGMLMYEKNCGRANATKVGDGRTCRLVWSESEVRRLKKRLSQRGLAHVELVR